VHQIDALNFKIYKIFLPPDSTERKTIMWETCKMIRGLRALGEPGSMLITLGPICQA